MPTLLVTDEIARDCAEALRRASGGDCVLVVLDASQDALPDAVAQADVAFLSVDLMGGRDAQGPHPRLRRFARAVQAATALRWIHTQATGADRDLLQIAMRRGVTVTTSSGASAQSVAHTAIAGMLAHARGVAGWIEGQSRRQWSAPPRARWPRDIDGSQAMVVGTGPIGQAIARIAAAMGMRVCGVRRDPQPLPPFERVFGYDTWAHALPEVDWLFLACPLTPLTRGLIDAVALSRLQAHAGIVNVARGEVVVEAAVQAALREGRLAAYYGDVFADEPLGPDSAWWDTPRTLISPHVAAAAQGYAARTVAAFVDNLDRYVRGEPLRHVATLASPG